VNVLSCLSVTIVSTSTTRVSVRSELRAHHRPNNSRQSSAAMWQMLSQTECPMPLTFSEVKVGHGFGLAAELSLGAGDVAPLRCVNVPPDFRPAFRAKSSRVSNDLRLIGRGRRRAEARRQGRSHAPRAWSWPNACPSLDPDACVMSPHRFPFVVPNHHRMTEMFLPDDPAVSTLLRNRRFA